MRDSGSQSRARVRRRAVIDKLLIRRGAVTLPRFAFNETLRPLKRSGAVTGGSARESTGNEFPRAAGKMMPVPAAIVLPSFYEERRIYIHIRYRGKSGKSSRVFAVTSQTHIYTRATATPNKPNRERTRGSRVASFDADIFVHVSHTHTRVCDTK